MVITIVNLGFFISCSISDILKLYRLQRFVFSFFFFIKAILLFVRTSSSSSLTATYCNKTKYNVVCSRCLEEARCETLGHCGQWVVDQRL